MGGTLKLGWPNRLTIGRILLVGPFIVCLLNQDKPGVGWLRWVAIGVFSLMAVSDLLDGYLARRLNDESDLGRFLDPLADKLLITTAVLALCLVGVRGGPDGPTLFLPNWVVVAVLGKDLLVCTGIAVLHLATGRATIEPRLVGKWCTVVQLLLVLAMLLWLNLPGWLARLPEVLWIGATILSAAAAFDYLRVGTRQLIQGTAGSGRPASPVDGDHREDEKE